MTDTEGGGDETKKNQFHEIENPVSIKEKIFRNTKKMFPCIEEGANLASVFSTAMF